MLSKKPILLGLFFALLLSTQAFAQIEWDQNGSSGDPDTWNTTEYRRLQNLQTTYPDAWKFSNQVPNRTSTAHSLYTGLETRIQEAIELAHAITSNSDCNNDCDDAQKAGIHEIQILLEEINALNKLSLRALRQNENSEANIQRRVGQIRIKYSTLHAYIEPLEGLL